MNVSFKTIRRSGDKVYILSEISGYDERLPVVLAASTESGARIPSDTFPYCDVADPLALRQVLSDGALANREMPFPPLHTFEGNAPLLRTCVRDLYEKIGYANFEIVVVNTAAFAQETKACLAELAEDHDSLSVLEWDGPFNKAQIANFAVKNTQGEFLLFLNDDASILTDDALEQLLGYFQRPDVGVVGPKQLFIDGTVEHAGIVVGGSRVVTPLFRHMDAESQGYLDRAVVAQNVSAVTGDCMMLRRSAYEEVGGFSEEFTLFYADVDFCLKVRNAGYYTVFTPHVLLSHLHSVSRMRIRSKEISIRRRKEAALLQSAWPSIFVEGDAFYNPNLNPDSSYFAMKRGKPRG